MAEFYPQNIFIADLVHRAIEFKTAYQTLTDASPNQPPPSWPRYFLLSHSIELALKAFLALHGKSAKELRNRPFQHDLNKLLKEAVDCGLILGSRAHEDISLLAKAHYKHWSRYTKEDNAPIVVIEEYENTAAELLEQVSKAIYPSISVGTAQIQSGRGEV